MTTRVSPVAAGVALPSPNERGGMTIPALDRLPKPVFEDLHIIDVVPLQSSPDNDPLHGFGHVEPGTRTGRVPESHAVFMTPTHQIATVVAGQVIQDEQHTQRRVETIQLL